VDDAYSTKLHPYSNQNSQIEAQEAFLWNLSAKEKGQGNFQARISIWTKRNLPADIVDHDWTYTKNNESSNISAKAMTSVSLLENHSSNHLPVGNISFYSGEAMDLVPTFEKNPVLDPAINSYSYNNVAEDQFDLRFPARPQIFPADLGRYSSFGYLP
jgi:hypothetical protein